MKEIGPIPGKLWPFESTPGHPSTGPDLRLNWESFSMHSAGCGIVVVLGVSAVVIIRPVGNGML